MEEIRDYFKDKKNLINLLAVAIMIVAIPVGVKLAQTQKNLFSKATGETDIVFLGPNVHGSGTQKTLSLNAAGQAQVSIQFTAPPPPYSNTLAQSKPKDGLVKTAHAQDACTDPNEFNQEGPCVSCTRKYFCCDSDPGNCDVFDAYPGQCDSDPACSSGGGGGAPYQGCHDDISICTNRGQLCDWFNPNSDGDGCVDNPGGEYLGCQNGSFTCLAGTRCDWFNPNSDANGCIAITGGGGTQYSTCRQTQVDANDDGYDYCNDPANNGGQPTGGIYTCDPSNNNHPSPGYPSGFGDGCYLRDSGAEGSTCQRNPQTCTSGVSYCTSNTNDPNDPNYCPDDSLTGCWTAETGGQRDSCEVKQESACWVNGGNVNPVAAGEICGQTYEGSTVCKQFADDTTYPDGCDDLDASGDGTGYSGAAPSITRITMTPQPTLRTPDISIAPFANPNPIREQPYRWFYARGKDISVHVEGSVGTNGHIDAYLIKNPDVVAPLPFDKNGAIDPNNTILPPGCGLTAKGTCSLVCRELGDGGQFPTLATVNGKKVLEDGCFLGVPLFGGAMITDNNNIPSRYSKTQCKPAICTNADPNTYYFDPAWAYTDADEKAWAELQKPKTILVYSGTLKDFSFKTPSETGFFGLVINAHNNTLAEHGQGHDWDPAFDKGCSWDGRVYVPQGYSLVGTNEGCQNVSTVAGGYRGKQVDPNLTFSINNPGYGPGETPPVLPPGGCHGTPELCNLVNNALNPSAAPSARPSASTVPGGSIPPGTGVTTTQYRFAEDPTSLATAAWRTYPNHADVVPSFIFASPAPGRKFIFAQFKDSNGRVSAPESNFIDVVGSAPIIIGCSVTTEGANTVLNITGTNFGTNRGSVRSGTTNLTVRTWANTSVAASSNGILAGNIPVTVVGSDGQSADGVCSASTGTAQIALGANLFCPQVGPQDISNVKLSLAKVGGSGVTRSTGSLSRLGVVSGLNPQLEVGQTYKVGIEIPRGLRRVKQFTATSGTANIPFVKLPLGDIFPLVTGDEAINSADKSELNKEWIISAPSGVIAGDFNNDNRVNSVDWACMRYDFNAPTDPEPAS